MARIAEICPVVQVGTRSMDSSEKQYANPENIFFAKDIYDNKDWFKKAVSKLSKKVYITIDVDIFDPSIMPSVGTPEPGGIKWYDFLRAIRRIIGNKNVVGFDVVEFCPIKDFIAPDFTAAKLIYKILGYIF